MSLVNMDHPAPVGVGDKVKELLALSIAPNTRLAYASRIKMYEKWCAATGVPQFFPTSPGVLANYIAELVNIGNTVSTIEQTMAAISFMNKLHGADDTTKSELIKRTMKGVKRTVASTSPRRKKEPIRIPMLKAIISGIDRETATGSRDTAILLLGFAGAFRRSELVNLNIADLSPVIATDGRAAFEILVRHSKTDQTAAGMIKGIFSATDKSLCPVLAVKDYVFFCQIRTGPLFVRIHKGSAIAHNERLCAQSVAKIIQTRAKNVGIEIDLSGHSLRSGFITAAAEAGKTERSIQNQTGHRSVITLRSYIHRVNVLQDNAADGLV